MANVLPRTAGLLVALSALFGAYQLTVVGAADEKAAPKDAPKDDAPTLKKAKAKGLPPVGGYLGQKEIQEKLKITADERAKISEAQKAHTEAENKAYTEYEEKLRMVLGEDRWKELAKIIEDKRKEAADKRKKAATPTKTDDAKKPDEKKSAD